jgi:antitoxin ParD1/3/4
MRIITVNLPVPYLKAIDALAGEGGLYPSRSELIRVAVREFLIKEMEIAKQSQNTIFPSVSFTETPKPAEIPLEKPISFGSKLDPDQSQKKKGSWTDMICKYGLPDPKDRYRTDTYYAQVVCAWHLEAKHDNLAREQFAIKYRLSPNAILDAYREFKMVNNLD